MLRDAPGKHCLYVDRGCPGDELHTNEVIVFGPAGCVSVGMTPSVNLAGDVAVGVASPANLAGVVTAGVVFGQPCWKCYCQCGVVAEVGSSADFAGVWVPGDHDCVCDDFSEAASLA